jgi:hypothetical protein
MKNGVAILLLLSCLVGFPIGQIRACNDAKGIQNTATSASSDVQHCSYEVDECIGFHPGKECPPDTDGCGKCHCPGCGTIAGWTFVSIFKNTFVELSIPDWSNFYRITNYCYTPPSTSAHISALFRPPINKLG